MNRIDAKIWLLLALVVPLCGNTCTFHSTSNDGSLHIAVCVPSSPACIDPSHRTPADDSDSDSDSDSDTTTVGGNSRIASQPTASIDQPTRALASIGVAAPQGFDANLPRFAAQGTEIAALSEPVPALGPLSIAILVGSVGATALWKLRSSTQSA